MIGVVSRGRADCTTSDRLRLDPRPATYAKVADAKVAEGELRDWVLAQLGTSESPSEVVRPPGGPLSANAIGPARIGMSPAEVESVFERPDRITEGGQDAGVGQAPPPGEDVWVWDYPNPGWLPSESLSGVALTFVDGKLDTYSCTVPECETAEGLRVGDREGELRNTYGSALVVHPAFQEDPGCCGLELILPADDAELFPAMSFSDDGAGRITDIGGGYDAYGTN